MIILIHKICMAFNGLGNFISVEIVISEIAAILLHAEKVSKITVMRIQKLE